MGLPNYLPPLDDEIAAPFWDAIASGSIRLPRCSACGRWQWYPTAAGPDCADAEFVWTEVAKTGTLHTFTRVQRAFLPGGQADVPFVVGFVELDGVDGVRLVANVADDDPSAVVCDRRVAADFVDVDGRRHLLFRPA